jgi:hypothetical protein
MQGFAYWLLKRGDLWSDPLHVAALTLLAFAIFFVLVGATMLVFRRLGHERALALGLLVSQRNMGLMVAATGGGAAGPDLVLLRAVAVSDLSVAAVAEADGGDARWA